MTMKYKLKKPFKYGDELVEEFDLKEPKTKHLKKHPIAISTWTFQNTIGFISEVSGQPEPKIEMMSIPDMNGIMEVLEPFLGGSQETGDS